MKVKVKVPCLSCKPTLYYLETFSICLHISYLPTASIFTFCLKVFRWNVRLRVLDVSNFFSPTVSLVERPRLLANTFVGSVNEFNDLQELIVRDNGLTEILSDTFCKVISINKVKHANKSFDFVNYKFFFGLYKLSVH